MPPIPYFGRAINVAKAMALMIPLSVFGPVLFFFLRKDRLICGGCRRLLGGEVALPMLQAFSSDAGAYGGALAVRAPGGPFALYDPDEDPALLERKGQRYRARAWTWGALSAALAGISVVAGAGGELGTTAGVVMLATPPAIVAAWSALRSRSFGRLALGKRGRDRRARVLHLARSHGGRINVTLVAAELAIDLDEAERVLAAMVDGYRVEMEVDDAGRTTYVFTELQAG